MRHKDIHTTMRYADCASDAREAELVGAARDEDRCRNIVAIRADLTSSESTGRPETTGPTN
jgi:hypothetical protein